MFSATGAAIARGLQPAEGLVAIGPETTGFLYVAADMLDLLRQHRWQEGHYCPRCRSNAIKRINSYFVSEIFQCAGCGYSFNSTSGTIFQGSKLPLHVHVGLLIGLDHFGEPARLPVLATLAGVSLRTVKMQFDKLGRSRCAISYLCPAIAAAVPLDSYASLLQMLQDQHYAIDMAGFGRRLAQWLHL